jgi:hypothetical protein
MKINQIIKEYTDTDGQYTTTTAPADPTPNQGFAVRLTGIPKHPNGARLVWAALMSVLPKEFPTMGEVRGSPAHELVARLAKTGQPQIVKAGLGRDIAETIADKIANWPRDIRIQKDIVEQ